jgi:nucleoside-diphosphate-sugar epimerase
VFVTGATGFIGKRLVDRLLEDEADVRILTRRKSGWPGAWVGRVDVRQGDLSDRIALSHQVRGCSAVLHLAGELRDPTKMRAVNVEGTGNLLEACRAAGVGNVVYLSSVGVIGARGSATVDEETVCSPKGEYERSKHDAERLALDWSAREKIPLTVLRPTTVFGERSATAVGSDSMLAWLRAIRRRRFVFFDREAVANYVYSGDVAEACQIASSQRLSGVFVVADSCSLGAFVAAAASAMCVPAPRRFVPATVGYAVALVMQAGAMVVGRRSPLTVNRIRALSSRTRYSAERLRSAAGWQPTTGWEAGMKLTVGWYRDNGLL